MKPPTAPDAPASHALGGSRAALWVWGVLCVLCLGVIVRTPFKADLSAFLPAAPNAQQRLLIEQLQAGAPARSLMLALEGGTPASRVAGAKQLAEGLRRSGQFEWVREGDRSGFDELGAWVFDKRYALSPAVAPGRFTAAGLAEGIDDSLALLGTPAGSALKPLLPRDPTGETLRIAEAHVGAEGPRSQQGVWVSRDGKQTLLMDQPARCSGGHGCPGRGAAHCAD